MSTAGQGENIDALLARFPGPVSIYPSRVKLIAAISSVVALAIGGGTLCFSFYGVSKWLLLDPYNWFGLVSFVYLLAFPGRMLLPGKPLFTLDRQGIRIAMQGLRDRAVLWRDIKDIGLYKRLGRRWVCLTHRNVDGERSLFFRANWNIFILRFHSRPMTVDDLALLVNRWRERALESPARADYGA